jgi:DNA-binding LacI/PurR family transcriptional regulator
VNRPTMEEIARRARVSTSTVSRTLNRVRTVNPKIARRVWDAIAASNYRPNLQAKSLASGRTWTLGVLIPEIANLFFPAFVQSLQEAAAGAGYEILIGSTFEQTLRAEECLRRMLDRNVDGIALITLEAENFSSEMFEQCDVPLVLVHAGGAITDLSNLKIDCCSGVRDGIQHLAALGHRNIGLLSDLSTSQFTTTFENCFRQSLLECGIQPESRWISHGSAGIERVFELVTSDRTVPTAIVCTSDLAAIELLHLLTRRGFSVPSDVSVVGFGNIASAQFLIPTLSTIDIPWSELAYYAIQSLCSQINESGRIEKISSILVKTKLVVRRSTSFPPGSLASLSFLRK